MYSPRRKHYSQNFLYSRKLVAQLLGKSSIGKYDLVLEIGPGKGIITEQLISEARSVIAVEIDQYWYQFLKDKFKICHNLNVYRQDFLTFKLPEVPYKVFANIPFSIEGKITRKLLEAESPPEDTYLIVMKEPAYRWAGLYGENMFSIMHTPWFEFSITHHFRRTDFTPVPGVDAVFLRITKKRVPSLSWQEKESYRHFVKIAYGHGRPVSQNLAKQYGREKVFRSLSDMGIKRNTKPNALNIHQWIALYKKLSA